VKTARNLGRRILVVVSVLQFWLPRLAIAPITTAGTAGCACGERGSPMIFDAATVERNPRVEVSGEACNAQSVECMHRDDRDRCDTFWIVPLRAGVCRISVQFDDNGKTTAIEDQVDYVDDTKYPCRGNVRPVHDSTITRINSGAKAPATGGT